MFKFNRGFPLGEMFFLCNHHSENDKSRLYNNLIKQTYHKAMSCLVFCHLSHISIGDSGYTTVRALGCTTTTHSSNLNHIWKRWNVLLMSTVCRLHRLVRPRGTRKKWNDGWKRLLDLAVQGVAIETGSYWSLVQRATTGPRVPPTRICASRMYLSINH